MCRVYVTTKVQHCDNVFLAIAWTLASRAREGELGTAPDGPPARNPQKTFGHKSIESRHLWRQPRKTCGNVWTFDRLVPILHHMQRSIRQLALDTFRAVPINPAARDARRDLLEAFHIVSDDMMTRDYYLTDRGLSIMEGLTDLWGEAQAARETLDVALFRSRALAILMEG